jgi:aminopeptidase
LKECASTSTTAASSLHTPTWERSSCASDSPITATGIPCFHQLLLDENAGSHLALGSAYTDLVEATDGLTPDQLSNQGINQSAVHEDFVFGASYTEVDGIHADHTRVPILTGDDWLLT